MIYLPKAFERYLASLRLFVQMQSLKNGYNIKYLMQLKSITLAEALYFKNEFSYIDIIKLSNSLLGACQLSVMKNGKTLTVSLKGNGTYKISRRLYTLLLTETVYSINKPSAEIKVLAEENRIIIKASSLCFGKRLVKIIKALNGFYLYNKNRIIICVPTEKAEQTSEAVENEWCYILDRFSVVNVWLNP